MATTAPRKQVAASILDKIARAEPTATRRANIRDGQYVFEIRNILSEDKRKGHCFIVELGVVESQASEDPERKGILPNAVGTIAGNVINFSGGGADAAPGNVKRFILGLLGIVEEEMDLEENGVRRLMTTDERVDAIKTTYAELVSEAQPARGMLVMASTFCSKIQKGPNTGSMFVGVNWDPVPDQTPEMVAWRRKQIDDGVIGAPVP